MVKKQPIKKKTATKKKQPVSSNKTKQAKQKGQKQHTIKEYKQAIRQSNGILVNIAELLNVTRGAVTLFLKNHPELKELIEQKRESWIDKAENELFNQIEFEDEKDPVPAARIRQNASQFILNKLNKNYADKQEIEHSGSISVLSQEERESEIKRLLGR